MTRRAWWFTLGLTLLWMVIIGIIQWLKFRAFGYNGLDLGIYHQAVWSIAHGHGFASSIHDPSYLGDHLELWLVPVAAVYHFFSSPLTLLWIQTVVLGLAIIPLAQLAHHYLGQRLGGLATILFALHPLVYNVALYEFHGMAFALPILLWSIVVYRRRSRLAWLGLLLLLLAVREDMPFIVGGWAVLAAIDRRGWRWWLWPSLMALAWFVVAQKIIGAHDFVPGYKFLAFYSWMGDSYVQMATFPFRHPVIFVENIFGLKNWTTVLGFLASFGFLPLFRPRYLWPLCLAFANLLVLHGEPISFLHIHYTVPYLPFLAWAALVAVRDVRDKKVWPRWEQAVVQPLLGISIILAPLYSHLLFGAAEIPWRAWPDQGLTPPDVLRQALKHVNPADRVLTTFNLLPNLTDRPDVYSLNYVYLGRRQYSVIPYTVPGPIDTAIIDWQQVMHFQFLYTDTLFQARTGSQRIRDLLDKNGLHAVWWEDSVVVYRRDPGADLVLTQAVPSSDQLGHRIGPLTLLGAPAPSGPATAVPNTHERELSIALSWRVDQKPKKPLFIRFSLKHDGATVWTSTRLLGQGGYPADEWPLHGDWQTNYRLAVPDTVAGRGELSAQIVNLDGGYRLDHWRQFLPRITKQKVLGSISLGQVSL